MCIKQTRGVSTLTNVNLTVLAFISGEATTRVIVDEVRTRRVVLARFRCALIDVDFAMLTFKTGIVAKTFVGIDAVDA